MRKYLFSALVVLCAALSQGVSATPFTIEETPSIAVSSTADSNLAEQIIRHLYEEYDYDYTCLCEQYVNGEMTIEKQISGYLVSFRDGGGILIQILVDGL